MATCEQMEVRSNAQSTTAFADSLDGASRGSAIS